jgi:hypothetical protein
MDSLRLHRKRQNRANIPISLDDAGMLVGAIPFQPTRQGLTQSGAVLPGQSHLRLPIMNISFSSAYELLAFMRWLYSVVLSIWLGPPSNLLRHS